MSLTEAKLLSLPKYCDTYRFFLVEELLFVRSPLDYHHGKCSVIGAVVFKDGNYYLENICLRAIGKEYQIPSGSLRILLLLDKVLEDKCINSFAEVNGEAVFWRSADDTNTHLAAMPKTTVDLIKMTRSMHFRPAKENNEVQFDADHINKEECVYDEDKIKQYLGDFDREYVHAVKVHTLNIIDIADELMYGNLKLRRLTENLNTM